jgi:hypothetical protein
MLGGDVDVPFPENLRDRITNHRSLLTSHGRARGLAVPAAFRVARDLDQISGSGFENARIRISQSKSLAIFGL